MDTDENANFFTDCFTTAKLESSLAFYRAVGLEFVQEQHGSGPIHFSSEMDGTVIEIYPGAEGSAPPRQSGGATMLGFRVGSVATIVASLQQLGAQVVSAPKDSNWERRAVVSDFDGRAIELTQ
jgi:predicted enzyme related to lactoylglutathione lyase